MKTRFFTSFRLSVVVLVLGLALGSCDGAHIKKLDGNAPKHDVETTMTEILGNPKTSKSKKEEVERLQKTLEDYNSEEYWNSHRKIYIDNINGMLPITQPTSEVIEKSKDFLIPFFALLSLLLALSSFINSVVNTGIKSRKERADEMYQQLEFASIEFFKWESENRKDLVPIRDKFEREWKDKKRKR